MNVSRGKSPPTIQKAINSGKTSKPNVPKRKRGRLIFFDGKPTKSREKKKNKKEPNKKSTKNYYKHNNE
jgi:hypothetical protein